MLALAPLLFLAASAHIFSAPVATLDGYTLAIQPIPTVEALGVDIPVVVTIDLDEGAGDGSGLARISVTLEVIDSWRIVGDATQSADARAGEQVEFRFVCIAGAGTHAAHYPLRARATIGGPRREQTLETVHVVEVSRDAVSRARLDGAPPEAHALPAPGRLSLLDATSQVSFRRGDDGETTHLPPGWVGTDVATGTSVGRAAASRGDRRKALSVHPPWRGGWGSVWSEWTVDLPEAAPIVLDFATAIRDHDPETEPPSDGVLFEVWVGLTSGGDMIREWRRFSDAKRWEPAQVFLTGLGGSRVRIRLVTHPGPEHNTTCDAAFWGDPVLVAGVTPEDRHEPKLPAMRNVEATARAALRGEPAAAALILSSEAAAAVAPGRYGLADGLLTLAMEPGEITYGGFRVEIDGRRVGDWRSGFIYGTLVPDGDTWTLPVRDGAREFALQQRVWAEGGGLRVRFSLTGFEANDADRPRITHVSLGPASHDVHRLYAGHGNVLVDPGALRLVYNGFSLSTSFVGFDYSNGVSVVQATDIPPDALVHDPAGRLATLEASHDVTWTLVPSAEGAFDAARRYRAVAGLRAPASLSRIAGRMCLDQWGGDYARAAADIERAARYGLNDAVFVKHVWQRWGYDYRLPDIYPPAGDHNGFQAMVDACKRAGILFAPHDNYIDFYPDAPGFSYRHVVFNADSTPQRAWLNEGREAQSYRWLSHAYQPWMEANLAAIQDGMAPTSYFVDVFSAITPRDYYDQDGAFYPKTESVHRWGETFDIARERFNGAPMISEAGHDALIGHLDAAQADHMGWVPADAPTSGSWSWKLPAADGERVPWHDMVTHGYFALMAGGLGNRYQGDGTRELHGYGSDDYLTMTVLGGRNPMCDGPFNRSAVMTYWLLHGLCAELATREMTRHQFVGDDIHRQTVRFGEDSVASVNRGAVDWHVDGHALPAYGFYAESAKTRAAIERLDGQIAAWSETPGAYFFDARPPEHFGGVPIRARVLDVEIVEGRRLRLRMRWTVDSAVDEPGRPFLHFTNAEASLEGEEIAFQGAVALAAQQWARAGEYDVVVDATVPDDATAGTGGTRTYGVRFGIYQPEQGGRRLRLQGVRDTTGRQDGGELTLVARNGTWEAVTHVAPPHDGASDRLNLAREMVDFGPAATNGSFRLLRSKRLVVPAPDSAAFRVVLRMAALGLDPTVSRIEALDEEGASAGEVGHFVDGDSVTFDITPGVFAYRLRE
jgi:hypothetical protein